MAEESHQPECRQHQQDNGEHEPDNRDRQDAEIARQPDGLDGDDGIGDEANAREPARPDVLKNPTPGGTNGQRGLGEQLRRDREAGESDRQERRLHLPQGPVASRRRWKLFKPSWIAVVVAER